MTRRPDHGFTLVELLIVVAVIGLLAAAAVPTYTLLERQSNESSTQAALTQVRTAILATLPAWRGYAPGGLLTICFETGENNRNVNDFLFGEPVWNECATNRWQAFMADNTTPPTPTSPFLGGDTPPDIRVTGVIGANGDFCVTALHNEAPSPYHITDQIALPEEGACSTVGWQPSGTSANSGEMAVDEANLVSGLSVANQTPGDPGALVVSWDATAGVVYDILVSGQPPYRLTADSTGQAQCVIPSYPRNCVGAQSGTLDSGAYTISVRTRTSASASGASVRVVNPVP